MLFEQKVNVIMRVIDGRYPLNGNLIIKPNPVAVIGNFSECSTGYITLSNLKHKPVSRPSASPIFEIPITIPPPAPPPDPFPKFDAEASKVLQEFEVSLSLLCRYFKNNSHRQGEIGLFVEPLDNLYEMQKAYKSITAKALQTDGPSERQKKLESAGEKIGRLISWLEDIWHATIDGPYNLRVIQQPQASMAKRGEDV
ncbi:hypothetical protein EDD85DRAFT_791025 [Armillaria nabsnona]|nr:hypothetical protein EDD85DRAFT_791025 [Armillaria nabsnona]